MNDELDQIKKILADVEKNERPAVMVYVRRAGKVIGVAPKYEKYDRQEVNRVNHNVVVYCHALEQIEDIISKGSTTCVFCRKETSTKEKIDPFDMFVCPSCHKINEMEKQMLKRPRRKPKK